VIPVEKGALRAGGTFDAVEAVVATVEEKVAAGSSIETAAGAIRPDTSLPGSCAVGPAATGSCTTVAAGAGDADARAGWRRASTWIGAEGPWHRAGARAAARYGSPAFGVVGSSPRIRATAKAAVAKAEA